MAEESLISALYPPPPPFFKFFTAENLDKLKEYKSQKNEDLAFNEEDKDLEFLIPPKQPEGETYRSFGNIWNFNDKIPKLEDMGIEKLYKEPELESESEDSKFKIQELKKLLKSLLLNFLEIVGVMSVAPSEFATKVEHIRTILINIHHLLNEYRPHQSRESLILLLEKQIETKKNEIKEIEQICTDVEAKVKQLVDVYIDGKEPEPEPETENGNEENNSATENTAALHVDESAFLGGKS